MKEIITPSSTAAATSSLDDIESIDTDLLCNLLVQHRIPPIVAQRFKNEMMDGYVLSKLETIPVQLIPEIGVQIKFHEFFKKLTGRDLDYPAGYRGTVYEPIVEQEEGVIRRSPLSQQKNYVTPGNKLQVQYPSQLPEFSPLIVHYMETNDCIRYVHLMIRELVDYFIQNNYDLNDRTAARKICQTVLDNFPVLNNKIDDIYAIEARIRFRNTGQKPWNFLSKKFNVRKNYVKFKNIKVNGNSQQNVQQKPSDVDDEEEPRETQPIQINELDRLENVLAQHQEEDEVDYNNNNIEQVDHQYEIQGFIVDQQQQSESNFVIPNDNEDFLKQLADLADGRIRNGELEVEEQEHVNEEQDEEVDENKENVPQVFFFSTPTKNEKILTSRSINNISILTTNQKSTIKPTKRSASNNDIGEVAEKRCR